MPRRQETNPVGPDGKVRCEKHNVLADLRTSHQPASLNRKFWACPLRPFRGSQEENTDADCGFFFWNHELFPEPEPQPSPSSQPPPSTPTSTLRQQTLHFPTTPMSPTKRGAPAFNTPEAKAKRLKAIQDALPGSSSSNSMDIDSAPPPSSPTCPSRAVEPTTPNAAPSSARVAMLTEAILSSRPQTPPSPSNATRPSINSTASSATASSSSIIPIGRHHYGDSRNSSVPPAPTFNNGNTTKNGGRMTYNLSELNIDLSGPRISVFQPPASIPSSSNNAIMMDPEEQTSEDELWNAVDRIPPSSPDEVAANLLSSPDITSSRSIPTVNKGKQKATEEDREEEVFWNGSPIKTNSHLQQMGGLFSPSTSSQSQSQPLSQSSTTGLGPTPAITGDQIQDLVQGLSGIPDYVKKLERKLLAMQKSNDSKAKRIKELEAEVRELKSTRRA